MQCAFEKLSVSGARRARAVAGSMALLLGTLFAGAGCIIIPVPSLSPDSREGIIEDKTLEKLIGLDQTQVNEKIGYPDYSGLRGASYLMVYQGETRYSTDVYMYVSAGYTAGGGKIDQGTSKRLHCQVLELDANRIVQNYEVIVRPFTGITRREDSGYVLEPTDDCSEVVWGEAAPAGLASGQIEATKRIAQEREEREAQRIGEAEFRANAAELEQPAAARVSGSGD